MTFEVEVSRVLPFHSFFVLEVKSALHSKPFKFQLNLYKIYSYVRYFCTCSLSQFLVLPVCSEWPSVFLKCFIRGVPWVNTSWDEEKMEEAGPRPQMLLGDLSMSVTY